MFILNQRVFNVARHSFYYVDFVFRKLVQKWEIYHEGTQYNKYVSYFSNKHG